MTASSAQLLPPKTAAHYAERARRGEGVPVGDTAVEFPQFGNVICILYPHEDGATGHITKNPARAEELRKILAARLVNAS